MAFHKSGEKKIEKNEKRRLGRTTKIYISLDASNLTWTAPGNEHTQEPIRPILDTEQLEEDHESDTHSGDDTPDVDASDLTWIAPGPGSDNATGRRAVTRAKGRQTGIIHTALLFSYLDNPDN